MTPIEAMAEAVRKTEGCGLTMDDGEWVFCDDPRLEAHLRYDKCNCKLSALAALRALRENVSEEMGEAARYAYDGGLVWVDIIQAALAAAEEDRQ